MQRTISAMVGKGSINHNSRKFTAENVAPERTHLNIDYCNENIEKVYHKLFDEALKRYNDKQTRADRKIENYYDKIRTGKQEKPFHELILQIGDKDNMSAESENGQLAKQILDEYYKGFRERNPNLYVFSVHLHKRYLKEHKRLFYSNLLTSGKLNSYLADIDRQAEEMFSRLVKQMAECEGVTEQLKAENQLEWVGKMNNIRSRAVEIIDVELICV